MTTRAMAMAMAVGMLGCATTGWPRPTSGRPAGWIQDLEVQELAAHFAKSVDCRPGTRDPHGFMCPLAAMRLEPFVPPADRALLGIELTLDASPKRVEITSFPERLVILWGGVAGGVTTLTDPADAGQEAWNRRVVAALGSWVAGRPEPFAVPPWVSPLLEIAGRGDPHGDPWNWQPDRFLRVRNPGGREVVVQLSPLPGSRLNVALFPVEDAVAESAAHPQLQRELQQAYDARREASNIDMKAGPVPPQHIAGLRAYLRAQRACGRQSWARALCAMTTLALGGAPLPARNGVYLGLLLEFFRGDDGWGFRRVDDHVLSLLDAGPRRFRVGVLGPDNPAELEAVDAAAEALLNHLSGTSSGPAATSAYLLTDAISVGKLPLPPGAPFAETPARLYEGRIPGGDPVYIVFAPRKGGGALIGLYPEVPWVAVPESTQSAAR
ncbi:MAG TPA: hypothetical protein VMB50_08890 [Myxococcales bacterium]|nr:hypothetical protein [Myxococcales bacterium]